MEHGVRVAFFLKEEHYFLEQDPIKKKYSEKEKEKYSMNYTRAVWFYKPAKLAEMVTEISEFSRSL